MKTPSSRQNLIELLTTFEVQRKDSSLNRFLSELETRYSIARETISKVGSRVASDDITDISNEAKLVQNVITKQLIGIEAEDAEDILFYNEPLLKLEETVQSFSFSSNTFEFCRNSNIRSELMQEKKFTQSNIEQILSMNEISATDIDEDTDGDIDIDMVIDIDISK